jgi:hypothetical protein
MKYLIFIIILFLSCSYAPIEFYELPDYNVKFNINKDKSDLYNIKLFSAYSLSLENVKVKGWLNPEEIEILKYGDCTEKATRFSWLCYQYLGIKPIIYRQKLNGETHQAVYIKEYDYRFNWIDNSETIEILDFDYYFYLVEYVK